jgi:transcriptional regulator
MYQPGHGRFLVRDPVALLGELSAVVPATLVTMSGGRLSASILPMLFDPADGPSGTLRGHLARGNPQWREPDAGVESLAIFDGPEAYVSPRLYPSTRASERHVPTWNYVTVQAAGALTVIHDRAWLLEIVQRLTDRHEAGAERPWSVDDVPPDYLDAQLRAIVGLELRISRLDAKRKLSQNRDPADIAGVIAGLSGGTPMERALAAQMAGELVAGELVVETAAPEQEPADPANLA